MCARIFGAVTIANFVVFAAMAHYLGGDALNGRADAGRFYLSMYGRLTEVSQPVYTYSLWHAYSVIATFAAIVLWQLWARSRRSSND
jgi:hypothetical protein